MPSTRGFEFRVIGEPRNRLAFEEGALMMSDDNPQGLKEYTAEEGVRGYIGSTTKVAARNHRDGWVAEQ